MSTQKVVIIGGGIAGLCAGIYARKSGFDTTILEMHEIAGGLATAWTRRGYTFENCIHWFVGSRRGADLNDLWREVFDIDAVTFVDDTLYTTIERGRRVLAVPRDVDGMERALLAHAQAHAPADAAPIRAFTAAVRRLARMHMPAGDQSLRLAWSYLRAIPYLPLMSRWSRRTLGEVGAGFSDPMIRHFVTGGMPGLSAIAMVFSFAWMSNRNGGYPVGGSLRLIELVEERYRALGGEIRFNTRVDAITVRDGAARGVVLDTGERIDADIVISAADGHATIFDMLGGRYVDDRIAATYRDLTPFPSYLQVSLGIARDFAGAPGMLNLAVTPALDIDPGTVLDNVSFRIFNYDPTMAPAGKTSVIAFIPTWNHAHWVALSGKDPAAYEAEKTRIADAMIAVLEARFPGVTADVEVVDVATPATVIRYTNNWHGSMEGWLMTPQTGTKPLPCTLPGLRDFYMVGQWISPGGGLPSGLLTARDVIKRLCREHATPFRPKASVTT